MRLGASFGFERLCRSNGGVLMAPIGSGDLVGICAGVCILELFWDILFLSSPRPTFSALVVSWKFISRCSETRIWKL